MNTECRGQLPYSLTPSYSLETGVLFWGLRKPTVSAFHGAGATGTPGHVPLGTDRGRNISACLNSKLCCLPSRLPSHSLVLFYLNFGRQSWENCKRSRKEGFSRKEFIEHNLRDYGMDRDWEGWEWGEKVTNNPPRSWYLKLTCEVSVPNGSLERTWDT